MRRLLPALLLLAAAAAMAGCASNEVAFRRDGVVHLVTDDYRLTPQAVRVPAGRVTFAVRNTGRQPHNLVITRRGRERARLTTMFPGETERVTVRLARGTYRMSCSLAHHDVLGEYGTVSVR
jgi:plastocyanin